MLQFYAEKFMVCMNTVSQLQLLSTPSLAPRILGHSEFFHDLAEQVFILCQQLEALDLPFSLKSAKRLRDGLIAMEENIDGLISDLTLRLKDEMGGRVFLQVSAQHAAAYTNPLDGWEEIADRFDCGFDIEEARKCLALERHTAAVFHLMKVVEAGVLELQMFLEKRDIKAHFGSVIQKLENMTQKTKYDQVPDRLQAYLPFMTEVLPQLHAVKDSWRNKVSHVDSLLVPTQTFTEELALGVRDATQLLMKKLLSGLPQKTEIK